MNILVTGGAGFIGSHVADALLNEGHTVHIIDNLEGGQLDNLPAAAHFHQLDIRDEAVPALFERERFDVMMHFAAQMDVRRSVADPAFDADVNVGGFLNLMEAGRRNGLQKVVFASTGGAIYGEPDYVPQDEHHALRPLSPYGITKLVTEKYLFFYKHVYDIDYVSLRYANIYGPRQNPHGEAGVIAIFIKRMLEGGQAVVNGPGTQTRDYTYVGDVVRANLAALAYDESGIINIGTGIEKDVNFLFRTLRDLTESNMEEVHVSAKPGEQQRSVLSHERAEQELGWTPQVPIAEGLRHTVDWFVERHRAVETS